MNIPCYTIEHGEAAIHGDIFFLLGWIFTILSPIIIFFLLLVIFITVISLLTGLLKIRCEDDTIAMLALILSLAITGFITYSSIKNKDKEPYLIIWYENPTQKVKIQKPTLIDDTCLKIENGQLSASNPLSVPFGLYRKAIKITKNEEEKIRKAEEQYRDKIEEERKEKYADKLEIID